MGARSARLGISIGPSIERRPEQPLENGRGATRADSLALQRTPRFLSRVVHAERTGDLRRRQDRQEFALRSAFVVAAVDHAARNEIDDEEKACAQQDRGLRGEFG